MQDKRSNQITRLVTAFSQSVTQSVVCLFVCLNMVTDFPLQLYLRNYHLISFGAVYKNNILYYPERLLNPFFFQLQSTGGKI